MKAIDISAIKRLRKFHNKTQDEIADALSMSRQAYLFREKQGNFTSDELQKLATLLKTDVEDLYAERAVPINDSVSYLIESNVRTEALLRTVLAALAKVISEQTGEKEAKILADMRAVAEQQSAREMDALKKQAGL